MIVTCADPTARQLQIKIPVLRPTYERGPVGRGEGQDETSRVFGVADGDDLVKASDFNALPLAVRAAGGAPHRRGLLWRSHVRALLLLQSSAMTSALARRTAVESAGERAVARRWSNASPWVRTW
jgi:hypothetical protein